MATALPGASVQRVDPALVRQLPLADALIIADAASARIARATGFEGGIVIVGVPKSADERDAFRLQGTEFIAPQASPQDMASVLLASIPSAPDGATRAALIRTRRLNAAGEMALTLQHDFNNPLAALMAEVQMLQMDAPNAETQATAGRMLELVRRLTALSRSLDGVRDRK